MKKKILLISDAFSPQINGVVRHILDLSDSLTLLGHEVKIISPNDFSKKMFLSRKDGVEWVFFSEYKKLSSMIYTFSPDILHIITEGSLGLMARKYAIKNNVAFSTAFHTQWDMYCKKRFSIPIWISRLFLRWFHQKSTIVLTPSEFSKKFLEQTLKLSSVHEFANAVNTSLFAYKKKIKKYDHYVPTALFVGRIAPEKNIEAFLEINTLNIKKKVVGDGPLKKYFEKKYPNVEFAGILINNALVEEYYNADILVVPSCSETFGIVFLEAIACGTPFAALPSLASQSMLQTFPNAGVIDENLSIACRKALDLYPDFPLNIKKYSLESLGVRFLALHHSFPCL